MTIASRLLAAFALMAACVGVHAFTVGGLMRVINRRRVRAPGYLRWTLRFIRLAASIIVAHLIEISIWGVYYAWSQAIPQLADAWYFSAVTYTTTGYGDIVLPTTWRPLAAMEALTGILMCGWSTAFFFAAIHRIYEASEGSR